MGTQKRNAFSPIAFDKVGDIEAAILRDHFIGAIPLTAITTSGTFSSELTWTVTDEVGAATADVEVLPGEAGNPGIIRLNVGATTPADGDVVSMALGLNDDQIILDGSGVYFATKLRVPDVDAQKVFFGLTVDPNAAVNGSETDAVGFTWDPEDAANVGDAFWFATLNAGGTDNETVLSDVSYVQDDWVILECAADDSGATFKITTEDGTQTVNIEDVTTATMALVYKVENVGAAEEAVEIDSFVLRYFERTGTEGLGA